MTAEFSRYTLLADRSTKTALFINGVHETVLGEILDSQKSLGGGDFFLEPYKGQLIKMLKERCPMTAVFPFCLGG